MNIKTLIVDDEFLARTRLERLLSHIPAITVVGLAENGVDAISKADQLSPNLIIMDVQMPLISGLEAAERILESYSDDPPAIIFCTAYDQYALDAFKVNAADYLLKPVTVDCLENAIKRACQVSQLQHIDSHDEAQFLPIKHLNYVEKIPISKVCYFRTEGRHVVAGIVDSDEVFVEQTLKELEQKYFSVMVRAHRNSLLARRNLMKLVHDDTGYFVTLTNTDRRFMVSRRMLADVKQCFE